MLEHFLILDIWPCLLKQSSTECIANSVSHENEKGVVQLCHLQPLLLVQKAVNEPQYKISNNVVCVTSKASDQPALSTVWSEPVLVAYEC